MNTTHITAQARFDTPLGPVTLAATERGLAGLWFDAQLHHPEAIDAPVDPGNAFIAQAGRELAEYFRGERSDFTVPLDARGTAFQQQVWRALSGIASGATTSYGAIARSLGKAAAVRAVGAAVGRNPVSIIVPCHRVLGSDGSLTGYAGGLPRKSALLQIEATSKVV
jgi:methylated-DNA-[protein]-cysteine S-methyltransferase